MTAPPPRCQPESAVERQVVLYPRRILIRGFMAFVWIIPIVFVARALDLTVDWRLMVLVLLASIWGAVTDGIQGGWIQSRKPRP